uniref:Uncharacterized protein n=1 Tax=Aegilops tauschii subsp. strangulata TaxID=200361 RepID=A0A453F1Q9_AEGTS
MKMRFRSYVFFSSVPAFSESCERERRFHLGGSGAERRAWCVVVALSERKELTRWCVMWRAQRIGRRRQAGVGLPSTRRPSGAGLSINTSACLLHLASGQELARALSLFFSPSPSHHQQTSSPDRSVDP